VQPTIVFKPHSSLELLVRRSGATLLLALVTGCKANQELVGGGPAVAGAPDRHVVAGVFRGFITAAGDYITQVTCTRRAGTHT
jgi:hypothetical protein